MNDTNTVVVFVFRTFAMTAQCSSCLVHVEIPTDKCASSRLVEVDFVEVLLEALRSILE